MSGPDDEDKFLIAFSDLVALCRREKRKIIFGTLFFAFAAVFFVMTRPIAYRAEASFKEAGTSDAGLSYSMAKAFFGQGGSDSSEAITVMKSSKLLGRVIEKIGLQAVIVREGQQKSTFRKIWENIQVYQAYRKGRNKPLFPSSTQELLCHDVEYSKEYPTTLKIVFTATETFLVEEETMGKLGEGRLGEPFFYEDIRFTISTNENVPIPAKKYFLTIRPMESAAKSLRDKVSIEVDKKNKSVLQLTYIDEDRFQASRLLNTIMAEYQNHLKESHERHAEIQLTYLRKRQNEIDAHLKQVMEDYAASITSNFQGIGFLDSKKALDFLANASRECRQRIFQIALQSKWLSTINEGNLTTSSAVFANDNSNLQQIIRKVLDLKVQKDFLRLALQQSHLKHPQRSENDLDEQIKELEKIRFFSQEISSILSNVEATEDIFVADSLVNNPFLGLKIWQEKLKEKKDNYENATANERREKKQAWEQCKACYSAYLANLMHLLEVYERTLETRLSHEYCTNSEFQGIDLETADKLYLQYHSQLNEIEFLIQQYQFVIERLQDPHFEMSSLSSLLNDSVSGHLIDQISALYLELEDQSNRSSREQDRLKEGLTIQRRFLESHLRETVELWHLREDLIKKKIHNLQTTMFELINEDLAVLEKHFAEQLKAQFQNLDQEQQLIKQHLEEYYHAMSDLPKKWVSEQFVKRQVMINQHIVEEIAKLVESKNIASNLELVRSSPLEMASPPILPKKPALLFFALLGGGLGCFSMLGFILVKSAFEGLVASKENLRLAGLHVAGSLSRRSTKIPLEKIQGDDLETLRRLMTFFSHDAESLAQEKPPGIAMATIIEKEYDYTKHMASLLVKRGLKVVLLSLDFDPTAKKDDSPGLLQCLENPAALQKIRQDGEYNIISSGGISRYSAELTSSLAFQRLLNVLRQQYDWIIAVSSASPSSAEAENLMAIFDCVAIAITSQSISDLKVYTQCTTDPQCKKKISFIFCDR